MKKFSKVQRYCRSFCFSFAAPWIWNWISAWNWIWTWLMWLGLVDGVKVSQRVVGREHEQAFQPKKSNSFQDCTFRIVSELSPSFIPLFQVLVIDFHYWRQQFVDERTRVLDAWITILFG